MIDWILRFQWNGLLGITLYWLPTVLCVYGYIVRTFIEYQNDVARRHNGDTYYPKLTIGHLIGRGVVSIVPVANLLAAVFDVAPEVFGRFFDMLSRVFNQPLVPSRKP